jgi:tetratricopeptide (TPR) repeat protein
VIDERLDATLKVVSGYPPIGELFSLLPPIVLEVVELERRVAELWEFLHDARYADLDLDLRRVITQLETASRCPHPHDDPDTLHRLRAEAYQVAAAMLTAIDEHEAAWVANDRALQASLRIGDVLGIAAAHFRLGHTFLRAGRLDQAEHVTTQAIEGLMHRIVPPSAPPGAVSLYGAMHLVRAMVAARRPDAGSARWNLGIAKKYADRLGEDRNDYGTEFGPTNVEVHYVAASVDFGEPREALRVAAETDVSGLSPERQARFLLDIARAHSMRNEIDAGIAALARAEEIAPEMILAHPLALATAADILERAGPDAPALLRQIHYRAALRHPR